MRLLAIVYYRQTWGVLLLFYHAFLFNRELFFFILVSLVANFIYDVNNVAREEKMSQAQQTKSYSSRFLLNGSIHDSQWNFSFCFFFLCITWFTLAFWILVKILILKLNYKLRARFRDQNSLLYKQSSSFVFFTNNICVEITKSHCKMAGGK